MKRSYQREVILEYLKTRTDHPTADKVYAAVRETIPNISLGTVYRNLSQLSDNGMILRITCDTKEDHFDANIHPHPHLFCRECGGVSDIPVTFMPDLTQIVAPSFHGSIQECSITYYGICEACLLKLPQTRNA